MIGFLGRIGLHELAGRERGVQRQSHRETSIDELRRQAMTDGMRPCTSGRCLARG